MPDTLTIGAWISLHEGCEISSDVGGSNVGMMTVRGAGQQPFELYFRAEPLRQLLEVGTRTLAEISATVHPPSTNSFRRVQRTAGRVRVAGS